MNNTINILGTDYTLHYRTANKDDSSLMGFCDRTLKKIVIFSLSTMDKYKDKSEEWRFADEVYTIHHEIVHAYLTESGLNSSTKNSYGPWSEDEEIVDWISWMTLKMANTFKEAEVWLSGCFKSNEIEGSIGL